MFRRLSKMLIILVSLAGCSDADNSVYKEEAYVFGTLVNFTIVGVPKEVAQKAVKRVGDEFQKMHNEWHAWKPGELTRINKAIENGQTIEVSDFVLPVILKAKEFYQLSDGLFNPAIGSLIGAWGFHNDELPTGSLPSFELIAKLASSAPDMDDISINGHTLSSTNKNVQFDFGGFGKGEALDRAEVIFSEYGIKNAIINAGGDVNTMGMPGNRPWKVAIRHPVNWGAIASVELSAGEELYTSGNYERFRESEGIKYAHIIDPRDGMPVQHIVSASVLCDNGALADAAATALTIAGPDEWQKIAKKMGIHYAMLVDDQGTVYLNPAMQKRVKFEVPENIKIVVSEPLFNNDNSGS